MNKLKVLNLYACLGGNRLLWEDCHVTAVELDPELARLYQERFPDDVVIIADAHEYLLKNYMHFDFIWSSPPCPSHSRARGWNPNVETLYPDMSLYQQIILMETVAKGEDARFKGKYVIENVIPYYQPLIPAQKRGRHLYWSNFRIPHVNHRESVRIGHNKDEVDRWCGFHQYDFRQYKGAQRLDKIARNLVDFEAGNAIYNAARGIIKQSKTQKQLFVYE